MFHGTTIDELFQIVERAQRAARVEAATDQQPVCDIYPGFLAQAPKYSDLLVEVA